MHGNQNIGKGISDQGSTREKKKWNPRFIDADTVYVCKNKVARPTVFIPVFPGTNCEYDSAKAFERAGADVDYQSI